MHHPVRAAGREDADDSAFAGKLSTTSLRRVLSPLRRQVGVRVCRGLLPSCLPHSGPVRFLCGGHTIADEGATGTYGNPLFCAIHYRLAHGKDRREHATALRPIYTAVNASRGTTVTDHYRSSHPSQSDMIPVLAIRLWNVPAKVWSVRCDCGSHRQRRDRAQS